MRLDVASACWTEFKTKIRKKKVWHDQPQADLISMWKSQPKSLYGVLQSHQLLILPPLSYSFKLELFFMSHVTYQSADSTP